MYVQYTQSTAGAGILFGYDNDAAVPAFAPNSTKYVINSVETFTGNLTSLSNTRKPTIRFNFPANINVGALSQNGQQFGNIGDLIRPTVRLTNSGLQTANNITITATAPNGYISTRQVATLLRDSSVSVTFDSIPTTAPIVGQITYIVANLNDGYPFDDTPRVPLVVQDPNANAGIFDNGPLLTHPVGGYNGSDLSRLNLPLTTFGSNINKGSFKIMEDFYLPGNSNYTIDSMGFFGYQTGSPAFSTFTGLFVTIWDGHPAEGGTLLYGDSTEFESVLEDTNFTGIYRASASTPLDSTRPIIKNIGKFFQPTSLQGSRKYFIQWSMSGSLTSGPRQPAISVNGMTVTGNAQQFTSTGYQPMDGGGTGFAQGSPFQIFYRVNTTSVEEFRLGLLESQLYPNPAKDQAFLYLNSERNQKISFRITDISGRMVHQSEPVWVSGKTHLPLPVSQLTPGMYLVEVRGAEGSIHKKLQISK